MGDGARMVQETQGRQSPARANADPAAIAPAEGFLARLPLWVPPLLLAIVATLAFSTGLSGGFVLDDELAISRNPVVQGEAPLIDAFRLAGARLDKP